MLTNTPHQAPDRRPSNSCDPEPHASPRYPTPYWSDTIAAFSNFLWLPNSTANHDSLINTTQSWDSKTAAHDACVADAGTWRNGTASTRWFQTCGLPTIREGARPGEQHGVLYRREHGEKEAEPQRWVQAIRLTASITPCVIPPGMAPPRNCRRWATTDRRQIQVYPGSTQNLNWLICRT